MWQRVMEAHSCCMQGNYSDTSLSVRERCVRVPVTGFGWEDAPCLLLLLPNRVCGVRDLVLLPRHLSEVCANGFKSAAMMVVMV